MPVTVRGPGLRPRSFFVSGEPLSGSAADGNHAGRERPTGLGPEEVPPADHPGRSVPGLEAQALLREQGRSATAEGQVRSPPQGESRAPSRTLSQECHQYGTHHRYREVVQRREGLRLHHARERRKGLLRASHRDPAGWLQDPGRRPAGRVRGGSGAKGPRRSERREAVTDRGTAKTDGAAPAASRGAPKPLAPPRRGRPTGAPGGGPPPPPPPMRFGATRRESARARAGSHNSSSNSRTRGEGRRRLGPSSSRSARAHVGRSLRCSRRNLVIGAYTSARVGAGGRRRPDTSSAI